MSFTTCRVPGCVERIPTDKLMCYAHWKQVPKPLQKRIYSTWAMLRQAHSSRAVAAYTSTRDEAIAVVLEVTR